MLLLDIGDKLMDRSCSVNLSVCESHGNVLALKLYVHLGRQVERFSALWDTAALGLLRIKAKVLHLNGFLTWRWQEWLLLAGRKPLIHQYWGTLSTTRLMLTDEVWHFLRALRRVIGKAERLIILVVKLRRCLKSWSCVVELEVPLQVAFVKLIHSVIACLMILLAL